MTTYSTIGDFIRARRQALGLTQNALANLMGWDSPQFISNIERDEATLPPERIPKLSKVLKVAPADFVKMHMDEYRKNYEQRVYESAKASRGIKKYAASKARPKSKKK